MLPPFIIEQIRKREEEERRKVEQPTVQLPIPSPPPGSRPDRETEDRGVVIIDLG